MREARLTRRQHVALEQLGAIKATAANVAIDRSVAVQEARAAGLSYAAIGSALGISKQAVMQYAKSRTLNSQGGKGK